MSFEQDMRAMIADAVRPLQNEIRALHEALKAGAQKEHLTIREAAEYIGVSERTVRNRIGSGELKTTHVCGKRLIRLSDLVKEKP